MAIKSRIKLWVVALSLGKFKKAVGKLKRGNNYCALGVACKVYEKQTGKKLDYAYLNRQSSGHLPAEVKKWYGLHSNNPVVKFKDEDGFRVFGDIISLNDEYGMKLPEIASWVAEKFL